MTSAVAYNGEKVQFLFDDYKRKSRELTGLGINREILDCENEGANCKG